MLIRTFVTLAVTLVGLSAVSSLAIAAEAETDKQPSKFEGLYLGVAVGWERADLDSIRVGDVEVDFAEYSASSGSDINFYDHAATYKFIIGYDHVFDDFLLGVEMDYSPQGHGIVDGYTGSLWTIESSWRVDITGRAGYVVTPSLLFYGRVGYGWKRLHTGVGHTNDRVGDVTEQGIVFGGGAEYALSKDWAIQLEYRGTNMKSYHDGSMAFNIDSHAHQITVGILYRF